MLHYLIIVQTEPRNVNYKTLTHYLQSHTLYKHCTKTANNNISVIIINLILHMASNVNTTITTF